MKMVRAGAGLVLAMLVASLVSGCSSSSASRGDPARGEKIHEVCLDCHGTALYASPERKIKSLPSLRKEVAKWGDYYDPALSASDNEDVVAFLNARFYKFAD